MKSFTEQRLMMVRDQLVRRGIRNLRVLKAMSAVERHLFVDSKDRDHAYEDHPLQIGHGQTISQPYMVALMTEYLDLKPQDHVLEIGVGSGYQTAILAELCEHVYGIERIPELFQRARDRLDNLCYKNVSLICGDGTLGWPDSGISFQAILVAAGAPRTQEVLLDQLGPGGRMVIPEGGLTSQHLMIYKKTDGGVQRLEAGGCVFVPLYGQHGWISKDSNDP